jgi:beta-N-acetylhexosaminidase
VKKISLFTLVLLAAAVVLAGCAAQSGGEVDIRGRISGVDAGDNGLGTILVEGEVQEDTEYDKASVFVTKKTKIYRLENNQRIRVSFAALAAGQIVEVAFTGPVRESYPVQADAAEILILP